MTQKCAYYQIMAEEMAEGTLGRSAALPVALCLRRPGRGKRGAARSATVKDALALAAILAALALGLRLDLAPGPNLKAAGLPDGALGKLRQTGWQGSAYEELFAQQIGQERAL